MLNRNWLGTSLIAAVCGLLIVGLLESGLYPFLVIAFPQITLPENHPQSNQILQRNEVGIELGKTYIWLISGLFTTILSCVIGNLLILPRRRAITINLLFSAIGFSQMVGLFVSEVYEFGAIDYSFAHPKEYLFVLHKVQIATQIWYIVGLLVSIVSTFTVTYIRCKTGKPVLRTTKAVRAPLIPTLDSSNLTLPSPQDAGDNWKKQSWLFARAMTCSTPRPNVNSAQLRLGSHCISPIPTVERTVTPAFYSQCPTVCDINGYTAAMATPSHLKIEDKCEESVNSNAYSSVRLFEIPRPQCRKLSYEDQIILQSPPIKNITQKSTVF